MPTTPRRRGAARAVRPSRVAGRATQLAPRSETPRARTRSVRIVIRLAHAGDIDAVAAMRVALVSEHGSAFRAVRSDARSRARRVTERELLIGRDAIFVAVTGERCIAMLRCGVARGSSLVRPSRHAMLMSAYVQPEYRRRGILGMLVRAADGWCRQHGLRDMRLHCTLENAGGNAAWRALGFAPEQILHRRAVPPA